MTKKIPALDSTYNANKLNRDFDSIFNKYFEIFLEKSKNEFFQVEKDNYNSVAKINVIEKTNKLEEICKRASKFNKRPIKRIDVIKNLIEKHDFGLRLEREYTTLTYDFWDDEFELKTEKDNKNIKVERKIFDSVTRNDDFEYDSKKWKIKYKTEDIIHLIETDKEEFEISKQEYDGLHNLIKKEKLNVRIKEDDRSIFIDFFDRIHFQIICFIE